MHAYIVVDDRFGHRLVQDVEQGVLLTSSLSKVVSHSFNDITRLGEHPGTLGSKYTFSFVSSIHKHLKLFSFRSSHANFLQLLFAF